ncbi:MAG: helix-turn-helix domain-containing protein [Synergistaceae bacterium]|nr:helix-turn-helix domain-containing protein [Synergistaceae bacterium]
MPYSELIKNFERIRGYVREFYVYGFKSRGEYDAKSARSYDNERRRIESWLGGYMSFRQNAGGKNVFLSVDSREAGHNPLYNAFRAKSFTALDIVLHFYILDALADGESLSARELLARIDEYLAAFDDPPEMDESTVRNKLKEYEALGLLKSEKHGRELLFSRAADEADLGSWRDAVSFFSESDPLGVIGSFLLDKYAEPPEYYSFKHHYILHALESETLYALLRAISEHKSAEITLLSSRRGRGKPPSRQTVLPLKIYVSTQNGRRYAMTYHWSFQRIMIYRLDSIQSVKLLKSESKFEKCTALAEKFRETHWGVSYSGALSPDHIEMTVHIEEGAEHILQRLTRERRCGQIERAGANTWRFVADVYDAAEMLPWLRTFIGRIVKLECSNRYITDTFYDDLDSMCKMYGGDGDAV